MPAIQYIRVGGMRVPLVDDNAPAYILFPNNYARGYVQRDFSITPPDTFAPPSDMQEIPESEWDARFDEQEQQGSSLQHIRMRSGPNGGHIPSLDQNGQGYCWAYSSTMAVMLARAAAGLPYKRLSAHGVACKVKGFRDEGGWCGLSAKFIRETGVPDIGAWPEKSMSRSNDRPETWANAAKYKTTEEWVDLALQPYDQNLTLSQLATSLFNNCPSPVDFSWWGHSVCGTRWVRVERGSWGLLILNSWTDNWGEKGFQVLRGDKMKPMGALSIRTVIAA